MNKFFEAFTRPMNRSEGTHGGILIIVGAYIVYMGISMIKNTMNGLSEMSMTTTIVLASVMMLAGLAVVAWGTIMFIRGWKEERNKINEENTTQEKEDQNI